MRIAANLGPAGDWSAILLLLGPLTHMAMMR